MRHSLLIFAATTIINALQFTNPNYDNITVGQPFNITWTEASGPVSITLLKGGTANPFFLTPVSTLASGLTTSNFVWTPSSSLLRDVYDIRFTDNDGDIYAFQFELLGGPITSATATQSATSTTAPSYTATFEYPPLGT